MRAGNDGNEILPAVMKGRGALISRGLLCDRLILCSFFCVIHNKEVELSVASHVVGFIISISQINLEGSRYL